MADQDRARRSARSSAVSAMTPSERAAGSAVSSTWKSRSQPLRSASANSASSASCKPRDHIGHGAEQPRAVRLDHRLDRLHMAGRRTSRRRRTAARPAGRCGPASARARRRRRARRSRVCGAEAVEMGADGARAVRIGAAQRRTPCAPRRPRRSSCADRSAATVCERAGESRRSGLGARAPDMALVEMGVRIDEGGQHDAAGERQTRRRRRNPRVPPARRAAMRPSSMRMSTRREALRDPSARVARRARARPPPARSASSWRSR